MIQYRAIPYKQKDYISIFSIMIILFLYCLKNYNQTFMANVLPINHTSPISQEDKKNPI